MASVVPLRRDLAMIALDLATTRQRASTLHAATIGRDLDEQEDTLWSALDDRLDALEAEADAAFYAATGVSWAIYSGSRA